MKRPTNAVDALKCLRINAPSLSPMGDKPPNEAKILLSGSHARFIPQNAYLYCASEGLATVVQALIDIPALSKTMKLQPDQKIILAQSMGYPETS